jgi:hypothetical protein
MTDLRMLANVDNDVTVIGAKKKYHIASLKPEDFAGNPEIRNKYFWNKVRSLDRFHIPELSKEEYEAIAVGFNTTANNLIFETATPYYIRKARIAAVAKDLGCSPAAIDTKDYIWDERYYLRYNFLENARYVDEMYRDNDDDSRAADAYDAYIKQDPRTACIDVALWDELYYFCTKAIKARKAMLLSKVEQCLKFLISVLEYSEGFTANITRNQAASLRNYQKFFQELMEDKDFYEFLTKNNDINVFAEDENTHSDYVDTYRSLCKLLTRDTDEDMSFFKDMLSTVEDPYVDEILETRIAVETQRYE